MKFLHWSLASWMLQWLSDDNFSVVCSRRVHEGRKEVLNYDLYGHYNHGECAEAENNQQPLISMWNDLFIEWGG